MASNSLFCLLRNSTVRKANVRPNFTVSASINNVSPFFAALRKLQINMLRARNDHFHKSYVTYETLSSTEADFDGFFSCVSSANVDTLSVKADIIPPCRVSLEETKIEVAEYWCSIDDYRFGSDVRLQGRVHTGYDRASAMTLLESDRIERARKRQLHSQRLTP